MRVLVFSLRQWGNYECYVERGNVHQVELSFQTNGDNVEDAWTQSVRSPDCTDARVSAAISEVRGVHAHAVSSEVKSRF